MVVALDTTPLVLLVQPSVKAPHDDVAGKPIDKAAERVEFFVRTVLADGGKILLPTPAISEALTKVSVAGIQALLKQPQHFITGAFDLRAAIEAAAMMEAALASTFGKRGGHKGDWQKIKCDRQILAIAQVYGALEIVSCDTDHVLPAAAKLGIRGRHVKDLPAKPSTHGPLIEIAEHDAPDAR